MINRQDVYVSSLFEGHFTDEYPSRERYGISGGALGDCFTACCCGPCGMTQINDQLKDEEMALQGGAAKMG